MAPARGCCEGESTCPLTSFGQVVSSYSFASCGWNLVQAVPLVVWPRAVHGLLTLDADAVPPPSSLEDYLARSLGFALLTLGLVTVVLTGSLPLNSMVDSKSAFLSCLSFFFFFLSPFVLPRPFTVKNCVSYRLGDMWCPGRLGLGLFPRQLHGVMCEPYGCPEKRADARDTSPGGLHFAVCRGGAAPHDIAPWLQLVLLLDQVQWHRPDGFPFGIRRQRGHGSLRALVSHVWR